MKEIEELLLSYREVYSFEIMPALVPEHWKLLFDNLFAPCNCHAELQFHLLSEQDCRFQLLLPFQVRAQRQNNVWSLKNMFSFTQKLL